MREPYKARDKVIIRLDNAQLALALLGAVIVSTGTFAAGVVVGQRIGYIPKTQARFDSMDPSASQAQRSRSRTKQLAHIEPTTGKVSQLLVQELVPAEAKDPTEAARIETHRQLSENRKHALAGLHDSPNAEQKNQPSTHTNATAEASKGASPVRVVPKSKTYSLEVSAFQSRAPADVVAGQLRGDGHRARVIAAHDASGQSVWRVEVGSFTDIQTAGIFQRQFEKNAGYSTTLRSSP